MAKHACINGFFRKRGNVFLPNFRFRHFALFSELAPYAIKPPSPLFFFAGSIKEILYAAGPFFSDRRYKQKKREGMEGEGGGGGTFPGLGHRITLEEGGGGLSSPGHRKEKGGGGRNDHLFLKGGEEKVRGGERDAVERKRRRREKEEEEEREGGDAMYFYF